MHSLRSVEAYATCRFFGELLLVAFDRGSELALALGCGLLVVLAAACLGQDAGLLARALEATNSDVEGLVFFHFYVGHGLVEPVRG